MQRKIYSAGATQGDEEMQAKAFLSSMAQLSPGRDQIGAAVWKMTGLPLLSLLKEKSAASPAALAGSQQQAAHLHLPWELQEMGHNIALPAQRAVWCQHEMPDLEMYHLHGISDTCFAFPDLSLCQEICTVVMLLRGMAQ